jgi:hypothetical protein
MVGTTRIFEGRQQTDTYSVWSNFAWKSAS